jgi:hypothetical protein
MMNDELKTTDLQFIIHHSSFLPQLPRTAKKIHNPRLVVRGEYIPYHLSEYEGLIYRRGAESAEGAQR